MLVGVEVGGDVLAAVAADAVFFWFADAEDDVVAGLAELAEQGVVFAFVVGGVEVGGQAVFFGAAGWVDGGDLDDEAGGVEEVEQGVGVHGDVSAEGEVEGDFQISTRKLKATPLNLSGSSMLDI